LSFALFLQQKNINKKKICLADILVSQLSGTAFLRQLVELAASMSDRKGVVREFHFVDMDDPNRYKRLKVLRACDFCRKRKVKLVARSRTDSLEAIRLTYN
jgi:hypothetical protein